MNYSASDSNVANMQMDDSVEALSVVLVQSGKKVKKF